MTSDTRYLPEKLATAAGNGAHLVTPFVFPSAASGHDLSRVHDIVSADLNTTGGRSGNQQRFLELDMGTDTFPAYLDPSVVGFSRQLHVSAERDRFTAVGILQSLRKQNIVRRRILPQRKPISRVIPDEKKLRFTKADRRGQTFVGYAGVAVKFDAKINFDGMTLLGVFGVHLPSENTGWAKLYDLSEAEQRLAQN